MKEKMSEVTREDLNGLGSRITSTELKIACMETKVERNASDIQDIFKISEKIECTLNRTSIAVEEKLNKAKWQILVLVSIPIVLFVLNLFLKNQA